MKPVIKEGGTSRIFDAIKTLETLLQSSGSCIWVPEAKTNLTTKNISKNGVYVAKDDGAYGYSSVTVNVQTVGGITGTGSDGKQHTISTDSSGNLVDSVAPVSIAVTTPPAYVGPYGQGAYIGFDGIVVHAYDSSGADMGEVPYNELVFPVTVAQYDPDAPLYTENYQANFFDEPIITTNVSWVELLGTSIDNPSQPVWDCSFETKTGYNKMAYYGYVPAPDRGGPPNGGHLVEVWYASYTRVNESDIEYTYDGKTVFSNGYFTGGGGHHEWTLSPYPPAREAPNDGSYYRQQRIAWTMLYGEKTGTTGGVQIPVQWQRPGDGLVLETSFGISVVPPPSGTND